MTAISAPLLLYIGRGACFSADVVISSTHESRAFCMALTANPTPPKINVVRTTTAPVSTGWYGPWASMISLVSDGDGMPYRL